VPLHGVGAHPVGPNEIRQVPIHANDLAKDPASGKIYAALASNDGALNNSLAYIDPATGNVEWSVPLSDTPFQLAVSDDGTFVYAVVGDPLAAFGTTIQRVDAISHKVDLTFSLGPDAERSIYVADVAVMPGHSETVAVSRISYTSTPSPISIYDNGIERPVALGLGESLTFGDDPSKLYAVTRTYNSLLFVNDVSTYGISNISSHSFPAADTLQSVGGLIYASNGYVFNPSSPADARRYGTGDSYVDSLAVDPQAGRVFALAGGYFDRGGDIEVFNLGAYGPPVLTVDVPFLHEHGRPPLVRWGDDGFALLNGEQEIVLMRSDQIQSAGSGG
jgi:hypothetical protein